MINHIEKRKKIACGKKYNDIRGENTCGQKDWWAIDLCPECETKYDALMEKAE